MHLLHRDVEFDFSYLQIMSQYSLVPLTRNYERPVFLLISV